VKQSISGSPVYTNGHFYVEPCVACFVPGYLIVTPQLPAASLSELASDALASLGPALAAATRAIELVIRPERVLLRFLCRGNALCSFSSFSPVGVASVAVCRRSSNRSRDFRSAVAGLGSTHIPSPDLQRLRRNCSSDFSSTQPQLLTKRCSSPNSPKPCSR
jgi:hypothetical protein